MSYTFIDLALDILKTTDRPLTYQEIWQSAVDKGLTAKIQTSGKTPWQTLGARLYIEVRDNEKAKIIAVGKRPTCFFLKVRENEITADVVKKIENESDRKTEQKSTYHERDLHPLLALFANANLAFNRGRSIYTKTILHERSSRSGYNEWTHPDMVGFYLPLNWHSNVFELNRLSDNNSLKLYSFEIKKYLNKNNYRASYFQAVSNSSWAHEGYLVAVEILQDDDFLSELERLAISFGIGIIHIDPLDVEGEGSRILYPARPKQVLDWETINKLCEQNVDFERFLEDVKTDFQSKRIHSSEYDTVIDDIDNYIKIKLRIER